MFQSDNPVDERVSWIYVCTASVSAAACATVLLLHARDRQLAVFPSSLLLWRILCDMLLSLQFLVVNVLQLADADQTGGERACSAPLAFLVQFGLFGSLCWYACLALNLYLTVTRPFTRPSSRTSLFHGCVWSGAFFLFFAGG